MVERRGAYGVLLGNPNGRRPFRNPKRRWQDNTKMDLREVGLRNVLDRHGSG